MDDIEAPGREHLLDAAGHVERKAARPAPASRHLEQLADGQHAQRFTVKQPVRVARGGANGPPPIPGVLGRAGRGQHEDAVSATGQLAGEPAYDEVDLVGVLPGIRGDLRDGERLDHARQGYGPAHPSSARVVRSRSRRPSTPPFGKRRVTASARPDGVGGRLPAAGADLALAESEQSCQLEEAARHLFESGVDTRCQVR